MYWIQVRFREDKVWAQCHEDGRLKANQRGLVPFCYKKGGKAYHSKADNFGALEGSEVEVWQKPAAGGGKNPQPREGAIEIWTDGACSGNPGPAGLGVYYKGPEGTVERSEFLGEGTNNIAELMAILRGLEMVEDPAAPVDLMSDSSYSLGLLTKGWKAKANQELVAEVRQELRRFKDIQLIKVKGHAGVHGNERADELARQSLDHRGTRIEGP